MTDLISPGDREGHRFYHAEDYAALLGVDMHHFKGVLMQFPWYGKVGPGLPWVSEADHKEYLSPLLSWWVWDDTWVWIKLLSAKLEELKAIQDSCKFMGSEDLVDCGAADALHQVGLELRGLATPPWIPVGVQLPKKRGYYAVQSKDSRKGMWFRYKFVPGKGFPDFITCWKEL